MMIGMHSRIGDVYKFQAHYPDSGYHYDLHGILRETHAACVHG